MLLCKLIDILDNAVPWDVGPKFDSNQEPRYIQRDMRCVCGEGSWSVWKHVSVLRWLLRRLLRRLLCWLLC